MKIYLRNIKSVLRLHKQGRWFNNQSVYAYALWYTIKYFTKRLNRIAL